MKVTINSLYQSGRCKNKVNIYFTLTPENEVEKAVVRSLYGARASKPAVFSDGSVMIDFYPRGTNG